MSRTALSAALTLLAVAVVPGSAAAWHGNHPWSTSGYYSPSYYSSSSYYPSYYYSTPGIQYYYAPAPVYAQPGQVCAGQAMQPAPVYGPSYAQPTPAPASESREPPLDKKTTKEPPKVIESRSFSLTDGKGMQPVDAGKGACQVGFWNISGKAVRLTVDGQTHTIPRDGSMTLTLGREFAWHMEGQTARQERVPDGKTGHEIVLR